MIAFDGGVGNLERVEDAHRDLAGKVRECPRDADEANLAGVALCEQLGHRVLLGQRGGRRADVELHQVQMIRAHAVRLCSTRRARCPG